MLVTHACLPHTAWTECRIWEVSSCRVLWRWRSLQLQPLHQVRKRRWRVRQSIEPNLLGRNTPDRGSLPGHRSWPVRAIHHPFPFTIMSDHKVECSRLRRRVLRSILMSTCYVRFGQETPATSSYWDMKLIVFNFYDCLVSHIYFLHSRIGMQTHRRNRIVSKKLPNQKAKVHIFNILTNLYLPIVWSFLRAYLLQEFTLKHIH